MCFFMQLFYLLFSFMFYSIRKYESVRRIELCYKEVDYYDYVWLQWS